MISRLWRLLRKKPDKKNAQRYIDNGALWNAGVFVFKLSYILKRAHELIDFSDLL